MLLRRRLQRTVDSIADDDRSRGAGCCGPGLRVGQHCAVGAARRGGVHALWQAAGQAQQLARRSVSVRAAAEAAGLCIEGCGAVATAGSSVRAEHLEGLVEADVARGVLEVHVRLDDERAAAAVREVRDEPRHEVGLGGGQREGGLEEGRRGAKIKALEAQGRDVVRHVDVGELHLQPLLHLHAHMRLRTR